MMKLYEADRYLKYLILVIVCLLIILGSFNWFVNPYYIYETPEVKGFNTLKTEAASHTSIVKAYAVGKIKPRSICLGTSRAACGIDPDHPGWSYSPVYNLALPNADIYEMVRYMQHADAIQPLKQVVFMADFISFRTSAESASDFDEERLAVTYDGQEESGSNINDIIASLFSIDVSISSVKTIMHQTGSLVTYSEDGMVDKPYDSLKDGYRNQFISSERSYLENTYLPERFPSWDSYKGELQFDYYRRILQIAHEHGIDLRIGISPCHARQWEVLTAAGLWTRFEEWKSILVTVNEEEARLACKTPFPLWDFSVYNEFTTEVVPPLNDTQTIMHWWWNSSHYNKELGDIVLDYVFNRHNVSGALSDDFGVLLTSENIEQHLERVRIDQQSYRQTHPEWWLP